MKHSNGTEYVATLVFCLLLSVPAFAADSFFEWTGAAGGGDGTNWFNGTNWFDYDLNAGDTVPGADAVWINTGETVTAALADKGAFYFGPTRVMVASADANTPGSDPTGTTTLKVIDLSLAPTVDFRVGYNDQIQQAVSGILHVTNGTISVGENINAYIGAASGNLNGTLTSGQVDVSGTFSAPAPAKYMSSSLLIGSYTAGAGQSGRAQGELSVGAGISGVANITVGSHTSVDGANSANGHLTVLAGGLQPKLTGPDLSDSHLTIGTAQGANAHAVGSADITGNIVNFVSLTVGIANGTATTSVSGQLGLHESDAQAATVTVGGGATGTETVAGSVTMDSSLLETGNLNVGPGGTIILRLGGTNRVTGSTVTDAGTYSAIDATNAQLDGTVVADFDFVPPGGTTNTFDLLVTGSTNALDASTQVTLNVTNLPAGFAVSSFGVAQINGVEALRLVIAPMPTNPPTVLSIVPATLNVSEYSNAVSMVVTFSETVTNFNYLDFIFNATNFADNFNVDVLTAGPTNIYTVQISNFLVVDGVSNATFTAQVNTSSGIKDLNGRPLAGSVASPVIQVSANSYQLWAMGYGLSGTNFLPTADPDGDGLNNATEFMRDLNPLAGGDVLNRRVMIANIGGTNYLTCTMPVPKEYEFTLNGGSTKFTAVRGSQRPPAKPEA